MRVSVIVPAAGLFRHNEPLFTAIAAATAVMPLEVILPALEPPSPRLYARLALLGLNPTYVHVEEGMVGALLHAGVQVARGDWCVWIHDDARPKDFLAAVTALTAPDAALRVPLIAKSHNEDQAGARPPALGLTTRPIDRSFFAFRRDMWAALDIDTRPYQIDGYQTAIQGAFARHGEGAHVAAVKAIHSGGETLSGLANVDFQEALREDMKEAAGTIGVHLEEKQRPAVPRLIPRGFRPADVPELSDDPKEAAEQVNVWDAERFIFRGDEWPRVALGDAYTIPPLMEWYDAALMSQMGLGDALMMTAAPWHFKALYPWVKFRAWTYGQAAMVAERSDAWDDVVCLSKGDAVPSVARIWNTYNGIEGTPAWPFRNLGIESAVPYELRRMAPYRPRRVEKRPVVSGPNPVGIQLNGGWNYKRYAHVEALADLLRAEGFTPYYFGTKSELQFGGAERMDTPTWDHFADAISQLCAWIGFDSGGSYLANALGVPAILMFASHNPEGLIGACGANAPYRAVWPAQVLTCAARHKITCRSGLNAAFYHYGQCGLRGKDGPGADCLDAITPEYLRDVLLELLQESEQ